MQNIIDSIMLDTVTSNWKATGRDWDEGDDHVRGIIRPREKDIGNTLIG
jgi:hypothetical protein